MRTLFCNRYFFPDNSATSQILSDLAFSLVEQGEEVSVITSRLNYTDTSIVYPRDEVVNGVHVHRVWTSRFGRSSLLGRAVDYLTFYISAFFVALWLVGRDTIVVVKTDPPMISIVLALVCNIKRARYINWLQDLFPEVGAAAGISILQGMSGNLIKWVRNMSLKRAYINVVIGERMAALVSAEGVDASKMRVIHNWSITPDEVDDDYGRDDYLREWELEGRFIVGYSGNFGRAHDYETIRDAIVLLRERQDIVFLFIGGGVYYEMLKDFAESEGLQNIQFRPYQEKARLKASLSVPDIHLISLVGSMEGLIVPSKFYGIIEVGKPALFVGDKLGEIATIINQNDCGETIESGAPVLLAEAISSLSRDPEAIKAFGNKADEISENLFSRNHAIDSWVRLIQQSTG